MKYIKDRKRLAFSGIFLAAALFVASSVFPVFEAKAFYAPESFSQLANRVGPAVVNIRTEKEIKGGGRVFRNFRNPFGDDDFSGIFSINFLVGTDRKISSRKAWDQDSL